MEGSDVFTQGVEIGDEDDPFAGTDFGDFETVAAAEAEAPAPAQPEPEPEPEPEPQSEAVPEPEEPPVVNREGERVEAAAEEPQETPQEAAQPEPEQPPAAPQAAESAPQDAAADPAPDPTPASSGRQASAAVEDAPVPSEPRGESGRTTRRRYVILRVVGPGKFEQVTWHVDKADKMVAKTQAGSRRQTVALARGTEDALKIGYAAVGSPVDGATLIAVAAAYFQPKKVRPKEPEPTRQRLEIS